MTGIMARIRAAGERQILVEGGAVTATSKPAYDLEMRPKTGGYLGYLQFQFWADDRKQLAKLKANQELTIEGKIDRYVQPSKEGQGFVRFVDCKLVNPKPEE